MGNTKNLCMVALLVAMVGSRGADAAIVVGDLVTGGPGETAAPGVYAGNDDSIVVAGIVGMGVSEVGKADPVPGTDNGFEATGGPTDGEWSFAGPALVDFIAVKAGDFFALYEYTDANTADMRNMGLWTTSAIDPVHPAPTAPDVSHITGYTKISTIPEIPEPASALVWMLIGAVGLVWRPLRTA